MKAGDIIKHNPTGETWTVAAVCNRTKMLLCCGWPESMAPWSDCTLTKECDDTEHRKMLKGVMESCGGQLRGVWARQNLDELNGPTPAANTCEHGHLARKCEVCLRDGDIKELRAEVARLRSVCREAADEVAGLRLAFVQKERLPTMYKEVTQLINDLTEAGKEATDGQ